VGIRDNDGFISGQSIITEMAKHGFLEDQVRNTLRRIAARRLIETPHAHYRELVVPEHEPPEQFHFRATSIGIYHIRFWTGAFSFLDATSTDTPIFDEATRDVVAGLAASFVIRDRYRKAEQFRRYLQDQWHLANFGANYYDFPAIIQLQNESFAAVKHFMDHEHEGAYKGKRRGSFKRR
jgi:hypothetical protein